MSVTRGPLQKIQAKTAKGKRVLQDREPKIVEDVKTAIFMRGTRTSETVNEALADLYALKKPDATMLQKKNALHPFEGGEMETTLEFVTERNRATFAVLGVHSKKRPNSLVLTRMFDHHVLDMIELSVVGFQSIAATGKGTCALGLKPAFVFSGEAFEQRREYKLLQNMLLDLYRGHVVEGLNVSGLESVISVAASEGRVAFRVYRVLMSSKGKTAPAADLELMGPAIDWTVGRTRFASEELMRQALKKPRELQPAKIKNVSKSALGDTLGRVHVGKQRIDEIQTRKMKGLKRSGGPRHDSGQDGGEERGKPVPQERRSHKKQPGKETPRHQERPAKKHRANK